MSACRGCGKEITWAKTAEGSTVPVDTSGPIYQLEIHEGEIRAARLDSKFGINHFKTCSHANYFSKSKKKEKTNASDVGKPS